MPLTTWTDERLSDLFERYRNRYWPQSRRLRRFAIRIATLEGPYGQCDFDHHQLLIDSAVHPHDREVRATVLHEMVHAVVGRPGHHAPFWTELESLLRRGAPITVGFPELGERGEHFCIIPQRFVRCRRAARPAFDRARAALERRFKDKHVTLVTPQSLRQRCYDVASSEGVAWRPLWDYLARENGFIDLDGRLLPWAARYHSAARRGYVQGRRMFLEEQRTREHFEAMFGGRSNG